MNYPRPVRDSGLGMHLGPNGWYPAGRTDQEIARAVSDLKACGFSWVKMVVVDPYNTDWQTRAVSAFVNAGFEVIVRLFVDRPYPADTSPAFYDKVYKAVQYWVARGVHYFELRNESNLKEPEWRFVDVVVNGKTERTWPGWDAMGSLQARAIHTAKTFLSDAYVIQRAGGIPLTPALAPGGHDDDELVWPLMCAWWAANGGRTILAQSAIAVHNYMLNHPIDYPYDGTNQAEHKGQTLWSGGGASNCFLKFRYMAKVFRDAMGFIIPLLSTEDGARLGDADDTRYAKIDPALHRLRHLQIADYMAKEAESEYLCTNFWLWACRFFEAGGSPWEDMSWRSPFRPGEYLPVVDAFKQRGFVPRVYRLWPFGDNYVNIVEQLPKHPTLRYEERDESSIKKIVIHHSAADGMVSPEAVARYHISQGWPGIGYHYYVTADGKAYQTNYLYTVSYQVADHNADTMGICLAGDFTKTKPTGAQLATGKQLLVQLLDRLGLKRSAVVPHSSFGGTVCPAGDWWQAMLPEEEEPEETPEPVDIASAMEDAAWDDVAIPLNRTSAYRKAARAMGLGAPVTEERTVTIGGVQYRWQGYSNGILYTEVGNWGNMRKADW